MNKVERIHQDFSKALSLEQVAVAEIVIDQPEKESSEKLRRLNEIGFGNTRTAKETAKKRVVTKSVDLEHAQELKRLENLQAVMPKYRLIGLNALFRLCEKYGLYIGHSTLYTHGIPEKNLREIEEHRQQHVSDKRSSYFLSGHNTISSIAKSFCENVAKKEATSPQEYFVIAPRSYFDKDAVCIGRTLESVKKPKLHLNLGIRPFPTPDPIVVTPIATSKVGIVFQIATAWGKEADDTEVSTRIETETPSN